MKMKATIQKITRAGRGWREYADVAEILVADVGDAEDKIASFGLFFSENTVDKMDDGKGERWPCESCTVEGEEKKEQYFVYFPKSPRVIPILTE